MYKELLREIAQTGVLTDSLRNIVDNFSFNTVIMILMMVFTVVGGVDKIRGNKHGYGAKFDEAFATLQPLALAMIGCICLVPILKLLLEPIITPVYEIFGASPSMFAGTLLPIDSGAYPLAMELAGEDVHLGCFSGAVLGGTFGCLIVGFIPISLSMMDKKHYDCLSMAVLIAVITIPLGCIAGGFAMNLTPYKMTVHEIIVNLIPVTIVAALVALGLALRPRQVMQGFFVVGKVMQVMLIGAIVIAAFQAMTGLRIPLFRLMVEPSSEGGISPLTDSLIIIGNIALILSGAFPMVLWVSRAFNKPIQAISRKMGMNEAGGTALVATFASYFPALALMDEMNEKSRLIVITFAVSASYVFGDHLGFIAGVNQDMVLPTVVAKLVGGITAVILANIVAPRLLNKTR